MRRTALLLGATLAALFAVSGVAWALTTLQCPSDPYGIGDGTCYGTNGDDLVGGTDWADRIENCNCALLQVPFRTGAGKG